MNRLFFLMALSLFSFTSLAEQLTILATDLPPFIVESKKNGEVIELVRALMKKSGISYVIKFMPAKRSMLDAQRKRNTCVVAIQRNQERESGYKWVGPLLVNEIGLYSSIKKNFAVATLEEAKKFSIGVALGSAEDVYFSGFGMKTKKFRLREYGPPMLDKGRIDLLAMDVPVAKYYSKSLGIEMNLEMLIGKSLRSMACNIDIGQNLIDKLNQVLRELHRKEQLLSH